MFIVEIKEEITRRVKPTPDLWKDSKLENWPHLSNDDKGKLGTWIYARLLEHLGYEVRPVNDEGDLLYRKNNAEAWRKAEVKAATATLKQLISGKVNEHLWFNQIRPLQGGWDEVVLVGVFPNHIKVWRKDREEFLSTMGQMSSTGGLSHVGTDELVGVTLKKNTRTNNFDEWDLIHNDQRGDLL